MSPASPLVSTSPSSMLPTPQAHSKDFETAFSTLSSTYGVDGFPSPAQFTFVSRSLTSTFMPKNGLSALPPTSPSAVPIVPLARLDSASTDSTVIGPTVSQKAKRDYEAAFGELSSTYGIGVHVPALPAKQVKLSHTWTKLGGLFTTRPSVKPSKNTNSSSSVVAPRIERHAPFQAAFSHLSAEYGIEGNAPILPSKKARSDLPKRQTKPFRLSKTILRRSKDENAVVTKDYGTAFGVLASSYGMEG